MIQYINKAAVVAEIERRIKALHSTLNEKEAAVKFELKNFLYFLNTIEVMKEVDLKQKNINLPIPKGEEYKHMCISLAQGYEIDWIDHYAQIMVNEFGEPELFESFKKRHPNFAEDIRNSLNKYSEL